MGLSSVLAGILKNGRKVAQNPLFPTLLGGVAGAIGGTRGGRTTTAGPVELPQYAGLSDSLRSQIMSRLNSSTNLAGFEAGGIQDINSTYDAAKIGLDADLTSRGLATSPAGAAPLSQFQQSRAGDISRFRNTLPLVQRDMQAQDIGIANQLYQNAGLGRESTEAGGVVTGALDNMASQLGYMYRMNQLNAEGGKSGGVAGGVVDLASAGLGALGIGGGGAGAAATGLGASFGSAATGGGVGVGASFGGAGTAAGGGIGGALGTAGSAVGTLGGLVPLAAGIPIIGGVIAGGILASKLIGRGRKAADVLTGEGGIQREFENVLRDIDAEPGLTPQERQAAKTAEYQSLVKLGLEHAQRGSQQARVVTQMFDKISPLFGQRNPMRG